MNLSFGFLDESKKAIAIICPKCKNINAIKEELFSNLDNGVLKNNYKCKCGYESRIVDKNYIKEKLRKSDSKVGVCGLMSGALLIIGIVIGFNIEIIGYLAGIVSVVLFFICGIMIERSRRIKNDIEYNSISVLKKHLKDEEKESKRELNEKLQALNIPDEKRIVTITNKTIVLPSEKYNIWIRGNELNLFPVIDELKDNYDSLLHKVKNSEKKIVYVNKIEYFACRGEVFRENKISDGGSSLKGAVVGGVLAGGAGAIIGSRKSIKSKLTRYDTRETFINYFDENGEKRTIFFEFKDYDVLQELIPEKDYDIVRGLKSKSIIEANSRKENTKDITDKIRELAKLKDEGILKEEEFNEKKEQLLSKI